MMPPIVQDVGSVPIFKSEWSRAARYINMATSLVLG
jgi:hypothetical protein